MAVRRDGNQSGSRRPGSQGHPSRGGKTVGGGTKTRPRVYRSPTPTTPTTYKGIPSPAAAKKAGSQKKLTKQSRVGTAERQQRRLNRKAKLAYAKRRGSKASATRARAIAALRADDKKKDTDTKIGVGPLKFNIEAELEGRGVVAKGAKILKHGIEEGSHIRVPTRPGQSTRTSGVPGGELTTNLAKDAVDFGAQAVPSAYEMGAAAKEAAFGDKKRAKRLIRQTKEHDPIALTVQGRFDEAKKEAKKHPGLTALELYGAGSAVSRSVGGAMRHGTTRTKKVASRHRAPRKVEGTNLVEHRQYSKGIGGKAVQVAGENYRRYQARQLRERADKHPDPEEAAKLRRQATAKEPETMPNSGIRRRTNEHEDLAELRRRKDVQGAAQRARDILAPDPVASRARRVGRKLRHPLAENPKDHRAAIALMVAQRIVKPSRKSLQKELIRVGAEAKKLADERKASGKKTSSAKERANLRLRQQLTTALKDEGLDFNRIKKQARDFTAESQFRQAKLVEQGLLAPERARFAPLVSYAVQNMHAHWRPREIVKSDHQPPGDMWTKHGEGTWGRPAVLTVPDGHGGTRRLAADEIEAHMGDHNVDPGAYVNQAPRQGGARNYYSNWGDPQMIGGKHRTGEAVRQGTYAVDREVGAETLARSESLSHATDSYKDWVEENRYRADGERTDFTSRHEAEQYIADNLYDSPHEWTVVATRPAFGRKAQSEYVLSDSERFADVHDGINQALKGEGTGQFAIVPKPAVQTMRGHQSFLGNQALKGIRKAGRTFSGTVLTTQGITWPLGNVGEGLLRLALIRGGPVSLAVAHKTIKALREIDPKLADDFELQIGTGHLGSYEMANVHMSAEQLKGSWMEGPGKQIGRLLRTPGPKQMGQAWGLWTKAIFGGNGWLEHQLRLAAGGRHLRNQGFNPKFMRDGSKAMQKAAEQAAHGMKGTPEQVAAARFVDRAMGRYSKFSPQSRLTVAIFTPFVAWAVNAVKFLTDVLPRDHPILTGLLASSQMATEEWRNQHGLGRFIDGAAPGWMQPSAIIDGKLRPVGRYTPFGFYGDPLENLGGQVLPQWNAIQNATQGLDWKGDVLEGFRTREDVTDAAKLQAMGSAFAGAMVPFFGLQERIRDNGVGKALNPVKGYRQNPKLERAFNRTAELSDPKTGLKAQLKEKYPDISAEYAAGTPYEKLHREYRKLQEYIWRETKGESGHHYKTPYKPKPYAARPRSAGDDSGSTGGGGGWVEEMGGAGGSAPQGSSGSWVDEMGG